MRRVKNGLLMMLGSALSLSAAGQPAFPEPAGPFAVGRADIEILDQARDEIFTEDPNDKRRLLVSVYYPAEVSPGTAHSSYVPEYVMSAFDFVEGPRAWLSQGYADVPIRDGSYPVLIFSPGLGNRTYGYSSLLYDLASEGYVIAALWHPYSTSGTAFPDGDVIQQSEAAVPAQVETLEESLAELERLGVVWVADVLTLADELEKWNSSHPLLQAHLDLDRLGAFGHSFGGASVAQAAYQDNRIDAVINMDGTMFGAVTTAGSRAPLLVLESDPPPPTDAMLAEIGVARELFDAEEKSMADALSETLRLSNISSSHKLERGRHNAYMTDQLFLTANLEREQRTQRVGDIDAAAAYQQIRSWVADFMALHVRGE